jgi:hypothetical protein
MDAIPKVIPLLDAVDPRDKRKNRLNDPIVEGFLDYIDRTVAAARERRKIEEEAKLESRRLQVDYDRKLAYLQGRVEAARQDMMSAPDLPGAASSAEKAYHFWLTQLQHFKQQGRVSGLL